jgi:hypothetical protein
MRVKIGPYKDWIGPYTISNAIFFWVDKRAMDWDDEYLKRWDAQACEKFGNWLASGWVNDFCHWIDKFRTRKVEVRIDPYDTWSMDHTLALIVHPMLVQLKQNNHGYFSSDPEDAPQIGKGEEVDYGGNDTLALDRYNWIMDEMIWTFDQIAHGNDGMEFYSEENGWDVENHKKYDQRIANGLRLFGKYYRALWD